MNIHSPESSIERGRSLVRALDNTGISVLYQDRDLKVVWAQNIPPAWSKRDLRGLTDSDIFPASEAARLVEAKRETLLTGRPANLEVRVPSNGSPLWFNLWIDADRHDDNEPTGIVTTAVDITEQKQREQTLRALLREVSHRSKNLLAIIQSVATQTGRYSGTIDSFLNRFRGRLQSLASSQDLVTSTNWRGADLRELALAQIGRYSSDVGRNVTIEGVNPFLNPNAALHIGLAFHELAVNSVSYGALSRPDGRVRISATIASTDTGSGQVGSLLLVWSETIPFTGDPFRERRFGSVALERVVPSSLNGTATLSAADGLLTYSLTVPPGSFELE